MSSICNSCSLRFATQCMSSQGSNPSSDNSFGVCFLFCFVVLFLLCGQNILYRITCFALILRQDLLIVYLYNPLPLIRQTVK